MYTWTRYGGYEVSSHGDRRFSAFNAILPDGRSVEMHYQCDVKGYDPGGRNWRLGKGKPPRYPMTKDEVWQKYLELWRVWADNNPALVEELKVLAGEYGNVLSDRFASTPVSQARALAEILNKM